MISARLVPALALLLLAAGCAAPASESEDEILVFAASSLSGVAPELAAAYTERTGQRVRFSFGSSAALARQVAAGAPADILIAADDSVHEILIPRMPYEGAFVAVAVNELVLVASREATWPGDRLARAERVAVGDWRAGVPVGLRAEDWLRARGDWEALLGRLVPCADARATLAAVVSGAADAGVVYATDAVSTDALRIVEKAGPNGPAVVYSAYELHSGTKQHPFVHFIWSLEADPIWSRHGFGAWTPPNAPDYRPRR